MHHKLSFRRKLQAFFLSLLLVLLTAAGVPSAAYTAEAASADTTMAVHFLDVGQEFPIVKDTTPNMMNPRLYTTSYNKP